MFDKWRVRTKREYYGRAVEVELYQRFRISTLTVRTIMVTGNDFDQKLAEAIAEARQKAITLNGGTKHAARKLPR